jgi:hypothetical protein
MVEYVVAVVCLQCAGTVATELVTWVMARTMAVARYDLSQTFAADMTCARLLRASGRPSETAGTEAAGTAERARSQMAVKGLFGSFLSMSAYSVTAASMAMAVPRVSASGTAATVLAT